MKNSILSTIKFLIGWPLSFVALFFVAKLFLSRWNQIVPSLYNLNGLYIFLGAVAFIAYYFLRGLLWKMLLEKKGHTIPFMESTYYWSLSEIRRFIPGNVWSVITKTHLFSEKEVKKSTTLILIAYEAQFLLAGYVLVSLLALPTIVSEFMPSSWNRGLLASGILLAVFLATFILVGSKFVFKKSLKVLPHFTLAENLKLLFVSCASSLFFGLGTYFCASAVMSLHFWDIFIFVGIFVLSIFIGYMSLITPMGIGVREAAIAYALGKHIAISSASFISIFARIILIISELLFLGLCFLWVKTYQKK